VRIALDTNVLVSAFATRGLCVELVANVLADHELLIGQTVLDETRRVLRTKFRLDQATVDDVEHFLRLRATILPIAPSLHVGLRDVSDEPVLAEAVAGGADVLVTGDQDLLSATPLTALRIASPREFFEELRRR